VCGTAECPHELFTIDEIASDHRWTGNRYATHDLNDSLSDDLRERHHFCHPIDDTKIATLFFAVVNFGRSGRPDRSELARQIFAASVAITGVASEIADVSL
jgi:hypothetical protein